MIEDDAGILDAITIMLTHHDFDVDGYPDGLHLEARNFRKPHLFLVDCQLPKMSGLEICKYLKSTSDYSQVPLILMSAQTTFESACRDAGAVAFVNKPFVMKAFIELLNNQLN